MLQPSIGGKAAPSPIEGWRRPVAAEKGCKKEFFQN
jgi:hypothetical protein